MMKIERSPWVQGQGSYGYSARQPQQAMKHAAVHLGVAAEVLLSPAAREEQGGASAVQTVGAQRRSHRCAGGAGEAGRQERDRTVDEKSLG